MIADVLMPVAVDTAYSYRTPPGLALRPGDLVVAPLGPRQTIGVVWAMREEGMREHPNLKSLIGKADTLTIGQRTRINPPGNGSAA